MGRDQPENVAASVPQLTWVISGLSLSSTTWNILTGVP